MTFASGQSTYNIFPVIAVPGMLANEEFNYIVSYCAAEVIYPGRAVEIASDGISVQQVQQTSSTCAPIGIALLQTAREGAGVENLSTTNGGAAWQPGDMVQVLRRGQVWAEWSGTTQTAFGQANIYHSSTTATNRGKFTDTATSTGSGTEITAAPHTIQTQTTSTGTGNVILLEVNMPGAA